MALADLIVTLFFMLKNFRGMINYCKEWDPMDVPVFNMPDLLNIYMLSEALGVRSPVPKFPLINWKSSGVFGWAGSTQFFNAAQTSRQLKTKKPSNISDDAIQMVLNEIVQSSSDSTTFDTLINAVEGRLQATCPPSCNLCPQSSSSAPSPASSLLCSNCTFQSEITSNTAVSLEENASIFTSPINIKQQRKEKQFKNNKSNNGGVGSHKKNSTVMKLTIKQLMNEHPTAQTFLNRHGDLDLFSGCTAIERRYIRLIVLVMTGQSDMADVDINAVDRDILWKVMRTTSLQLILVLLRSV